MNSILRFNRSTVRKYSRTSFKSSKQEFQTSRRWAPNYILSFSLYKPLSHPVYINEVILFCQNVSKFRSPNQICKILDILANILGPVAYFSKPIFALKPWAQAGCFEYHKPYKLNEIFFEL